MPTSREIEESEMKRIRRDFNEDHGVDLNKLKDFDSPYTDLGVNDGLE